MISEPVGDGNPAQKGYPDKRPHGVLVRILRWIGSRELSVLIVLFALMAALWGFVELASEVREGDTENFDRTVLLAMRDAGDPSSPLGPGWVEEMGRDFTALGGIAVLSMLTLAVTGFLLLDRKRRLAMVLLVATLGALSVSTVLKQAFDRPRPDLVPHAAIVYTASFPSGHSMLAASTYLTLGVLLARVQRRRTIKAYILLCAVFATLLVGISRVYLGVHWPTDVLAGWTAGAGWALLCWLLARWLQVHGQVETEEVLEDEATAKLEESQEKRQEDTMNESTLSKKIAVLARMGYAARGVVYLVVGGLAVLAAMGQGGKTTDSKGALRTIMIQPFGEALLVVIILGLLGYSLWRVVQTVQDPDNHGTTLKGLGVRSGLFVSAVTHVLLAVWTIGLLMGIGSDSSQTWTRGMMDSDWRQIGFALAGVAVAVVGLAHIYKGWKAGFDKYIVFPPDIKVWARPICRFGLIARGFVWCIIAWFFINSAMQAHSGEIKGLASALIALQSSSYGSWLLGIVATGLFSFGLYSLLEAFYRRVHASF